MPPLRARKRRKHAAAGDSEPRLGVESATRKRVADLDDLIAKLESSELPAPHGCVLDKLLVSLRALSAFIGAGAVKSLVTEMVLLVSLGLHNDDDFTNVVITGNPGTGKTEMLKCVAKIWAQVFHGKRGNVTWLSRANLIGEHLGETAIKTARALGAAAPGVVVLDEVYALGAGENDRDSFSKECIDTINQFTSECREHLSIIVAGYRRETEQCFFARNRGLERRFPWRFHVEDYTLTELQAIAASQLDASAWSARDAKWASMACVVEALRRGRNNGGDTQRLLQLCKLAHARRIPPTDELRVLSLADIESGCAAFVRTVPQETETAPLGMYS